MPELPEVQTTVNGLQRVLPGLKITDVWTDLALGKHTTPHLSQSLKDKKFFEIFKKKTIGTKVISVERRAKNILINLNNGQTILVHMKMTGHLLFGEYTKKIIKNYKLRIINENTTTEWTPKDKNNKALNDPYNRFIHVVFSFNNKKHLAFSDTRKFGKITLLTTNEAHSSIHLGHLGPEPLAKDFTKEKFIAQLMKRPNGKIKLILMDQSIIAGIGNIYSDEMLWLAGIHPEELVKNIPNKKMSELYKAMREVLEKGIDFGGDSMSDYRNIDGERGDFQNHHNVYRKAKTKCKKRGCSGIIVRKVIGGRSAHFCPVHQRLSTQQIAHSI